MGAIEKLRTTARPSTPRGIIFCMSKTEILAELPSLSEEDRAEIRAKLDELAGNEWLDNGELSEGDKRVLDAEIAEYEKSPNEGSSLDEVMARVQAKLQS